MTIEHPIKYRLTVKAIEELKALKSTRARDAHGRYARSRYSKRRIVFSTQGPGLPRADRIQLWNAQDANEKRTG